jgi:hypothetical protein
MTSTDGTGAALVEFFDYLAKKGLMKRNTAGARKTAVHKVLAIDEDWEATDLRTLNVDEQVQRFQNLCKSDYSPGSLNTYESRFRSAVDEYMRYLNDPASYRPGTSTRTTRSNAGRQTTDGGAADSVTAEITQDADVAPPPRSGHVTYPFPLRPGVMAYVQLPSDFRPVEAQRMARFLESVALDPSDGDGE